MNDIKAALSQLYTDTAPAAAEPVKTAAGLPTRSEMFKTYQENIKRSEVLRAEILKGVSTEETEVLLLKACEAISLMTGEPLFYKTVKERLKNRRSESHTIDF